MESLKFHRVVENGLDIFVHVCLSELMIVELPQIIVDAVASFSEVLTPEGSELSSSTLLEALITLTISSSRSRIATENSMTDTSITPSGPHRDEE